MVERARRWLDVDERGLARAFAAGEDAALDELDRRLRPRLEQFFRGNGWGEDSAREAAQETIVRGLLRRGYDPERAAPRTYLLRIARNLVVDELRRGRALSFSDLGGDDAPDDDVAAWFGTPEPGPADRALAGALAESLLNCRQQLPDRERLAVALWLESDGELTCRELGELLGTALTNAWRLLQSAFGHLRGCLEQTGGL